MLDRQNNQNHFKSLLEHLMHRKNSAKELVEILLTRKKSPQSDYTNCFQQALPQDFAVFSPHESQGVHKAEKLAWPLFGGHLNQAVYLPIRAFRGDASRLWGAVDKLRIFRSSGTNSGPEGRSWACFSAEGLRFYKAASLTGFLGVLESRVLPFSGDFLNMSIVSLVPPVEKWPDSSLAQMVSWFSDIWPTEYADDVSPTSLLQVIDKVAALARPVCIVGTAFHFVNFLDEWLVAGLPPFKLPAGSILVETGGTKGKSRSIERSELYGLMTRAFGINESAIVGEYGMCELASQAWDFVEGNEPHTALSQRRFRFPWWVKVAVMAHPTRCSPSGKGALLVQDFARIDLSSHKEILPIQTEDLAELDKDNFFELKGRVQNAPLKGCSMRVEESIPAVESKLQTTASSNQGPQLTLVDKDLTINAQRASRWFEHLCTDHVARERLTTELQSEWLANAALENLAAGKPENIAAFVEAAKKSVCHQGITQRWLFIAPASHSIAMIHPLAAALTLGLHLRVRVPTIANIPGSQTFLSRALELANEHEFQITTLGKTWRLGPDDLLDGEHILIFGDDETCHWTQSFASGRVRSFGHATSLTLAQSKDFENPSACARILRDQLALRQRGCLSSRMILVVGGDADTLRHKVEMALPKEFKTNALLPAELAARSMEIVRLEQLGFTTNAGKTGSNMDVPPVIIASKALELKTLSDSLFAALSRLDLVVPMLILPETTDEIEVIKKLPKPLAVRAISCSEQILAAFADSQKTDVLPKNLRFTPYGSLDAPAFDGCHLGRPFFSGLE